MPQKRGSATEPTSTAEVTQPTPAPPGSIYEALALFHSRVPTINHDETVTVTTRSGGSYKYTYASLSNIMATIRPVLAECGLFVTFGVQGEGSRVGVEARLYHVSGQMLTSGWLFAEAVASDRQEGVKALGSLVQYLRRYALNLLLALTPESDDDGTRSVEAHRPAPASAQAPAPATEPPASDEELLALVEAAKQVGFEANTPETKELLLQFVNFYLRSSYRRFREIPRSKVLAVTRFLNQPGAKPTYERFISQGVES